MNDQWSGKTLLHQDPDALGAVEPVVEPRRRRRDGGGRCLHCVVAHPRSQKLGPTGCGEVAGRRDEALGVQHQRQLRQRAGRRAEDDVRPVRRVEGRLVARAQDVVRGLLVQRDRAADVRADLGVGDDVVDRPVHRRHQRPAVVVGRDVQLARRELDQDHARLREGVVVVLVALGDDRDHAARRRRCPPGAAGAARRASPRCSPLRQTVCRRSVCGSGPRSRSSTSGASASGAVASSIVRRISGRLVTWEIAAPSAKSRWNAARSAGADVQVVPLLRDLDVRGQVPHPDDRAGAEREQRDARATCRAPGWTASPRRPGWRPSGSWLTPTSRPT